MTPNPTWYIGFHGFLAKTAYRQRFSQVLSLSVADVEVIADESPGASPVARRPLAVALALTVVLSGVLPVLLLSRATAEFQLAWVVQLVCVAISGAGVALTLTTERLRPMQMCFWVFSYVWLGLAPLTMLTLDVYPWPLHATPDVSLRSSVIVLLGLMAYAVAVALGGRPSAPAESAASDAGPRRELSPTRTILLGLFALAVAVVLVPRLGGVGAFLQSREAANDASAMANGSSGNAQAALAGWGLSVPAFWALIALLFARFPRGGWQWRARWLLLPPVLLLNVVVNNPISQPRYWAGTVIIALVLCTRRLASPYAFRALALLLLVAVVVVFPLADYFRYNDRSIPKVSLSTQLVTNPDYDAYQQIQGGVLLVRDTGHHPLWGAALPAFWVPRAVWPDKPRDAGPQIAEHLGYAFTNLSSPLWVESYIWGGFGSVALTFAALGLVSGRLDAAYDRARRLGRGGLVATFVPPLALYQLIVLRGSLLQAMAALSLLLIVPLLASRRTSSFLPSHRSKPRSAPATGLTKEFART